MALDAYRDGKVDRVILASTQFINTMSQKPTMNQLLPLQPVKSEGLLDSWDYLYEPSAEELLDYVLTRYVESQVYQGVIENGASEQGAHPVALIMNSRHSPARIGGLEGNLARGASV